MVTAMMWLVASSRLDNIDHLWQGEHEAWKWRNRMEKVLKRFQGRSWSTFFVVSLLFNKPTSIKKCTCRYRYAGCANRWAWVRVTSQRVIKELFYYVLCFNIFLAQSCSYSSNSKSLESWQQCISYCFMLFMLFLNMWCRENHILLTVPLNCLLNALAQASLLDQFKALISSR